MIGWPALETERLELRVPEVADGRAVFDIIGDPRTGRYLGPRESFPDHFTRFMRGAGSWMLYGYGFFMLREHGCDAVIGTCGIFHSFRGLGEDFDDVPEAGWIIAADKAGQGYASEAMRAVLAWFDKAHGPRRIVCMIEPDNAPSIALAGKLGFAPMRQAELPDGATVNLYARAPVDSLARLSPSDKKGPSPR